MESGQLHWPRRGVLQRVIRDLTEREHNKHHELWDHIAAPVPQEVNAVPGPQVNTAIGAFGQAVMVFGTDPGTPVRYRAA